MPSNIKKAAKQFLLAAPVARGYAVKCYMPGHVEYVLTDAGLAPSEVKLATEISGAAK